MSIFMTGSDSLMAFLHSKFGQTAASMSVVKSSVMKLSWNFLSWTRKQADILQSINQSIRDPEQCRAIKLVHKGQKQKKSQTGNSKQYTMFRMCMGKITKPHKDYRWVNQVKFTAQMKLNRTSAVSNHLSGSDIMSGRVSASESVMDLYITKECNDLQMLQP